MGNELTSSAVPRRDNKVYQSSWEQKSDWEQKVKENLPIKDRIVQETIGPGDLANSNAMNRLAQTIETVTGLDRLKPVASIKADVLDSYVAETRKRLLSPDEHPSNLEDGRFALEEMARSGFKEYNGDYVAVYNKLVVGSGDEETALRERVAKEKNIDLSRLFVIYKGPLM